MYDRVGIIKSLSSKDKKVLKDTFMSNYFGPNRLYAIGLVYRHTGQIDLRLYNDPYLIPKYNDDILIGAGELHLLEEETKDEC